MGDFGYCFGYALIGVGLIGALIGWIAKSFAKDDPDVKVYVPCRERNKYKRITDEGLAAILRAIVFTSSLLSDEKEYIHEAADRLEKKGETENEVSGTVV